MSRLENNRCKRIRTRRKLLVTVLCVLLFCTGLKVVDMNTASMLGNGRQEVLFKLSDIEDDVIQVDFMGEKLLIDKKRFEGLFGLPQRIIIRYKEQFDYWNNTY